jgi:hypothetical protein
VAETLLGESPEIYPFLGNYLLAEVVDQHHADLSLCTATRTPAPRRG